MNSRILVGVCAAAIAGSSAFAQEPVAALPPASSVPAADARAILDTGLPALDSAASDRQVWVSADYLFTWFGGDRLPTLITTSPAGTAKTVAGIPGPSTATLFGGDVVNDDLRSGVRMGGGYWFSPERYRGIEAGLMLVESQATGFAATSTGTPILARPFLNATTGVPEAALIAFPGSSTGSVIARASSGNLYGANIAFTENVCDKGWLRLDSIFGYRFYRYDEGLRVQESLANNSAFAPGTTFSSFDSFSTENTFNGADFGFRSTFTSGDASLTLLTKVAVGNVDREVTISGGQTVAVPGVAPVSRLGGLLAEPTNIGVNSTHDWTILPEVGATFGWQATPNIRVTAGYTIFGLERIDRAGDQVIPIINTVQFTTPGLPATGPSSPAAIPIRTDLWVQTINVGVEFSY